MRFGTTRTVGAWAGALRCLGATVLVLALALVVSARGAAAQNTTSLRGRVTASDGKALAGVQVAVRNRETGQQRGGLTTSSGTYNVVGLPPGPYHVSVQMLGYGTQERDVNLLVGQQGELDFQLQQGAVELNALVVEKQREPVFEVQRQDVSTPVVTAQIVNLPLNTRNTISLAAIVPGVRSYAPTAGRALPSVGSLPDLRFWNFYLDGAEWKSFFNGNLVGIPQTGSPIPQEAVKEFRVHLNPYDAEYTRAGAYVISAVSQRGTNDWHGSIFGYGQNNSLNSLDMFQRRAKAANPATFKRADYNRAQAGFNVRGPVMKDRLFFSASYEYQNTNNAIAVVPGRPSYAPGVWDQYAGTFTAPTKNQNWVFRGTAAASKAHELDLTWAGRAYNSQTNFGGTGAQNSGINARYTVHSVQLRDTWTPSDKLVNEASLNMLYWHHNEAPLAPGPTLSYPDITLGTNGFPLELIEKTFRAIDRLTYSADGGRHTLSSGVEIAKVNTNSYNPTNQYGFFQFRTDTSSQPFLGRVAVGITNPTDANGTTDARAVTSGWSLGAYAQDRWQMTRDFQLTLGLRWDAELNTLANDFHSPFARDPVLQAIPLLQPFLNNGNRKNDLADLAPRGSFSWDVFGDGRTYLRGGAGIMYDRTATFMAFNEKVSAGWRVYDFNNPGTKDPNALRQQVISGQGTSVPSFTALRTDMKTPRNIEMSIGVGQQLGAGVGLNIDYIHQNARNLYVSMSPNWLNTATGHRNLTDRYGTITLYDDFGRARFDAVASNLTWTHGASLLNVAYTLSWMKSQFEGLGGYNDQSFFIMQPTTGDERHRVVISGLTKLPYDFRFSAIGTFATPRPYVATLGQDLNHDNSFTDDFLNGVGARVVRPATTWANMYRTVDFRLAKDVTFGGRSISVSGELFNAFNWNNYSGFFSREKDAAGNLIANYGSPSGVYAPRQGQVGIRYEF
ncbi:MAG TPA: carboxypeptidase regulatory-like domain-containing protein [Longimicrobiales bacterium]